MRTPSKVLQRPPPRPSPQGGGRLTHSNPLPDLPNKGEGEIGCNPLPDPPREIGCTPSPTLPARGGSYETAAVSRASSSDGVSERSREVYSALGFSSTSA